jgi:hypothetical protein
VVSSGAQVAEPTEEGLDVTDAERLCELVAETCTLSTHPWSLSEAEAVAGRAEALRAELCALAAAVSDPQLVDDADGAVAELDGLLSAVEGAIERLLRASA